MHNKYIITFVGNATIMPHECEKWYNSRNILTSPCTLTTSPLSAPEREVTSPSDFKVVGDLTFEKTHFTQTHRQYKILC